MPPVGYETARWRVQNPDIYSRNEVRRQTGSYESSITPPLERWMPRLGSELLADVEEATLALREFDFYAVSQLGVDSPTLGPMSAILLRTESASSSQIEQLTASAKQIALAELDEGGARNARVVVGNVRAMEAALRLADRLDVDSVLLMHRELLSRQRGMEHEAGRLRDELVWVGGRDSAGPRTADFVAQQAARVPDSIADLISFMARTDLPALVQVAVSHAQFETIHPFVDGNGRTGRALAQALLRNKGVSVNTTVPLSAGLLTDTDGYFTALTRYREGDAGAIIRQLAAAARYAVVTGRELVDGLRRQLADSHAALGGLRSQSLAWRILPLLVAQPVVDSAYLQATLGAPQRSVDRALVPLVERGVLVESTGRSRNRMWEHRGILGELDAYAETVRRATRQRR